MSKVWESIITSEMVKDYTPDEIELLIVDLDDAVMGVLEDYDGRTQ